MVRNGFLFSRRTLFRFLGLSATASIVLKLVNDSYRSHHSVKLLAKELSSRDELISVQLITRHGARTPLYLIPGIEEVAYKSELLDTYVKAKVNLVGIRNYQIESEYSFYDKKNVNKKLKGGACAGMLTTVGEKQMYELGRRLRERYIDQLAFLSNVYDQKEVYARSTHFLRTIRSAKSVLAGLFTDPSDSDAEFSIHVNRNEDDWVFPNALNCPLFSHIHTNTHNLPLLVANKAFAEHLSALNKHLADVTGKKNITFSVFRDDLIARQTHGLEVPEDLVQFLDNVDLMAGMEMASVFEHNIQVSCGPFLHLIKKNINKAIEKEKLNVKHKKFIYFSAHDSTLSALLVAINLGNENKMDYHWPPFAASIIIETWKSNKETNKNSNEDYYVKVLYLEKPLVLSQCKTIDAQDGTKCTLDSFLTLLEKSSATEEQFNKQCNVNLHDYKF